MCAHRSSNDRSRRLCSGPARIAINPGSGANTRTTSARRQSSLTMMKASMQRKISDGSTLNRIRLTALVNPWMLRSSRVMIAPMPSLRCKRNGMLWSLPMVASRSAYCSPIRVRQVSQFAPPSKSSRSKASPPNAAMLDSSICSRLAVNPSNTVLMTRGSIALHSCAYRKFDSA